MYAIRSYYDASELLHVDTQVKAKLAQLAQFEMPVEQIKQVGCGHLHPLVDCWGNDTRNNFVLEFIDYYIDPPRYTIEEFV